MRKILIVGGDSALIKETLKNLALSEEFDFEIVSSSDVVQGEPCTKSEVDALTRLCRPPVDSMDFTKHPDNKWRGGSRKKGGKTKYRRG